LVLKSASSSSLREKRHRKNFIKKKSGPCGAFHNQKAMNEFEKFTDKSSYAICYQQANLFTNYLQRYTVPKVKRKTKLLSY